MSENTSGRSGDYCHIAAFTSGPATCMNCVFGAYSLGTRYVTNGGISEVHLKDHWLIISQAIEYWIRTKLFLASSHGRNSNYAWASYSHDSSKNFFFLAIYLLDL